MRITVYRRAEPYGYGEPHAFLGEDKPEGDDWFVNAKADLPEGDQPPRLLLLGRAFLIYSMYHAREPLFLGYAVENFGAACKRLGYSLPLKEDQATWRSYSTEGMDPGRPEDYQFLFGHIATVFGPDAATAQAHALRMEWPSRGAGRQGNGRVC